MKPLSILVADDEEDIRVLVQRWLLDEGHTVVLVANATEAAKLLTRIRFDVIVTDVIMPDGDGVQLSGDFKREQPQVRILAISGGNRYMDRENCVKIARGFGAHAALLKPFKREQLLEGIAAALAAESVPGGAGRI